MASLTPNELLDWLVQNLFLGEARAQPFRSPPAQYTDATALARDLIQRGWLTPFQVNQILQGKGQDLILGPYRLLERVGEGAMGQVFKGWNPKLERIIAIKMIHKEHLTNKKATERFRREIHTASQLEHPNIVRVYDADEVEYRPYLVMDFVDGIDLSRMVKQGGPLPVWQAADYARQAALGLQHAFERGVVHRDVKPGNLLVTRDNVVKILDFGLARFETGADQEGRLTTLGAMLGTVDYIAPEQAENAQAADVRADIYSLGCTLYYLLAGRGPFPGSTIVEKVSARMVGEAPGIRSLRADVPPGLEAVLKRMMARNVADRFQTPQEAAIALQTFCDQNVMGGSQAQTPPLVLQAAPSDMPVARPVTGATASSSPPTQGGTGAVGAAPDPFAFSRSSDPAAPAPVPTPAAPVASVIAIPGLTNNRLKLLFAWGGGLVVALLFFFLIRGCGRAKDEYPPGASVEVFLKERTLTVNLAKPNQSMKKTVIVYVKRHLFQGPVKVFVKGLRPSDGIRAETIEISEKKREAELPITVSYTKGTEVAAKVVAVAKNLTHETALKIRVLGIPEVD